MVKYAHALRYRVLGTENLFMMAISNHHKFEPGVWSGTMVEGYKGAKQFADKNGAILMRLGMEINSEQDWNSIK